MFLEIKYMHACNYVVAVRLSYPPLITPQLSSAREELEKRESRWSSTLARHRKRIEGLEARNKELQDDLRVMEQERLSWWQEQVCVCGEGVGRNRCMGGGGGRNRCVCVERGGVEYKACVV